MNNLKLDDCYAFEWVITYTAKEVMATHIYNPNNRVQYCDKANKEKYYSTSGGMIHSVVQFCLNESHVLTILSGPRSNWEPLHERIRATFSDKASFDTSNSIICKIKCVKFKELQMFFKILEDEPRLAPIDFEKEIAFTEFRKPPFSSRLKAINYDLNTLPEKFFDTFTMELMDDPVIALIDEPIAVEAKGRYTYDRKSFEKLDGRCPISNRPLKKYPLPDNALKSELLNIIREAEARFQEKEKPEM